MYGLNDLGDHQTQERPAPLISFVVPVYNASRYLTACLDSIAGQEFVDLEIIAVDGASDDGSERMLDARASVEPRLTVLHEARIGPGIARNIGAARASGDYLWFVDADDVISDRCLSAVAAQLTALTPDVLLLGYEIVNRLGRAQPGPDIDIPYQTAATCFTVADYPKVLEFSMASWNKIVRREFFASSGAAFDAVWPHEDIPVSCLMLLEAEKLAILSQACYRYRKDSPGSTMTKGDARRHFRVFDAWRPVLEDAQIRAKAGDAAITAEVYRALFERAMWYEAMLLDTGRFNLERLGAGGYVAWRDRREFFALMNADFVRFEPPDYRPPGGLRGIKFQLIQHNLLRLYSVLDPINKVRVWVGNSGHFARGRI
jgi:CDP-glycerol glycerophosphotransferase